MTSYTVGPFRLSHASPHKLEFKTRHSAGFDLPALLPNGPLTIPHGAVMIIPTGLYVDYYSDIGGALYELQIRPRSSNSLKGLDVKFGTIDADYIHKPIGVIMYNHSGSDYTVTDGDRVAQMICAKVANHGTIPKLTTERTGGFGSTGEK